MGLFSHTPRATIGALIDVGSASVLVALVASRASEPSPHVIWSHREHIALRSDNDLEQLAKNVIAAFLNATLELDTTGRKVLAQTMADAPSPSFLTVTVAAPWSYTVTKTVSFTDDTPFTIDKALIRELERTTEQKITEELKETDLVNNLGLTVVTKGTVALTANGYPISATAGQQATSLTLARTSAIIQKYLSDAINECHEKMWRSTTLHRTSFMFAYFMATRSLFPTLTEYCLVDVTYEATEIGVVRDGVLQYCTHTPYGAFSIARDVAQLSKTPLAEAYGRLTAADLVTAESNAAVSELYREYEKRLSELFMETGDTLSIPKTIILHSNLDTEAFFSERLKAAAAMATHGSHHIIPVSKEIVRKFYGEIETRELTTRHDTALLVSAQFFHTHRESENFIWQ
jgi:hypothetical protein